jgi:hypothetical protein
MSKNQKTKFKFLCPIFGIEVFLILGDKKQLKSITENSEEGCFGAETHILYDDKDIVKGFLVWLEKKDNYYGMVHETLHLVKGIFKTVQISFNEDNDEIIAYYQEYWVKKFWSKMSKFIEDKKDG